MIRQVAESLRLRWRLAMKWQAEIQLDAAQSRVEDAYSELAAAKTDLIRRERLIAGASRDVKLSEHKVGRAMQRRAIGI